MPWNLVFIGLYALALVVFVCGAGRAFAQGCPRVTSTLSTIASGVRTLEGRLVFRDGIRQWFALKLEKPQCGQKAIQLLPIGEKYDSLKVLRGCRVKSMGVIDYSPTGYFSLDFFQDVKRIQPVGACSRKPLFPDDSGAKPDKQIRAYRVDMHVIYLPGDHPIIFHVWSGAENCDRGRPMRVIC